MAEIQLAKGRGVALIDDEDYQVLSQYPWCLSSHGYAVTTIREGGKQRSERMHRMVLSPQKDKQIDHINNDRLDNRKSNLRICSPAENSMNAKKRKDGKSKYKGVYKKVSNGYYSASIQHNGDRRFLGYYAKELDAAYYYNQEARSLFGDFAYLNDIPNDYTPNEQFKPTLARGTYSKYRGVTFSRKDNRYIAQIQHNGKRTRIGSFKSDRIAAEMYNAYAREFHGDDAILNEFSQVEGVITT